MQTQAPFLENKKVYLFELDSVHTTKQEIRTGQEALYLALLHGNTVVLSMNQLVDSKIMMNLFETAQDQVFTLMDKKRICVSRYDDVRTFLQYVQKKMMDKDFIFSYIEFLNKFPQSHPVFDCFHTMVRQDEPDRIYHIEELYKERYKQSADLEQISLQQKDAIYKCVNLLLEIGRHVSYLEARKFTDEHPRVTLFEILRKITDALLLHADKDVIDDQTINSVQQYFMQYAQKQEADDKGKRITRSALRQWISQNCAPDSVIRKLAFAELNIAYNISAENNIEGLTCYHDFNDAKLLATLTLQELQDQEDYNKGVSEQVENSGKALCWNSVLRLTNGQTVLQEKSLAKNEQYLPNWDAECQFSIKNSKKNLCFNVLITVVTAFFAWIVGDFLEDCLDTITDVDTLNFLVKFAVEVICLTWAFDYIGSRINAMNSKEEALEFTQLRRDNATYKLAKLNQCYYCIPDGKGQGIWEKIWNYIWNL